MKITSDTEALLESLVDGQISRREFFSRAAVLGISVGTAGALLERVGGAAAATRTPLATPQRGGTLVHSSSELPNGGFDPNKHWDWFALAIGMECFDPLLKIDPFTGKLGPWLSTMPTVNASETVYTFKLNPHARFQTGAPVTAADAKFTLERLLNPAFGTELGTLYYDLPFVGVEAFKNQKTKHISGIKVVDAHTLELDLERPESTLLWVLGYSSSAIVPEHVVTAMGDKKFDLHPQGGSGPFKLTKVNLETGITLQRNPGYWNQPYPYVDQVNWSWPVDPSLAVLRIQQGQQDTQLDPVPTGDVDRLRNDPQQKDQLVIGDQNLLIAVSMNLTHPAMKHLKVRQAIAMAIDKKRIVQVLAGVGEPATGGVMTSHLDGLYSPGLGYKFDPTAAKKLLQEAGYPNGFNLTYWAGNISPLTEQSQVIEQNLSDIGIKVDMRPRDMTTLVNEWIAHPQALMDYEIEIAYPNGSYMFDQAFSHAAIVSKCCNPSGWYTPESEKLLLEGHEARTQAQVDAIYRKLDRIVTREDVVWVPTVYLKQADFVSKRVRPSFRTVITPAGTHKAFYRYWLSV